MKRELNNLPVTVVHFLPADGQDSYTASGLANLLYRDLLFTESGIEPRHTTTEQLHIATALKQSCQNIDKAVAEMADGEVRG